MREYYKPEIPKKEEAETEEAYNKRYQNYLENSDINKIEHTGEKKRNRYHHGFIAQEVETLIQNTGIDFGGYQDHLFKYDKRFVEILLEHEASKIDENNNDENSAE